MHCVEAGSPGGGVPGLPVICNHSGERIAATSTLGGEEEVRCGAISIGAWRTASLVILSQRHSACGAENPQRRGEALKV
jgi:hypothetical protein